MAGYGKGKSGGFSGNMVKLGGKTRKLKLDSDMKSENLTGPSLKKGTKQPHKRA